MQQVLVMVLILSAVIYLLRHVYQLFFTQHDNCKGCGLTPKNPHETNSSSASLPIQS